jgi:manganese/zinc/iron transport system permease protein
MLAISVAIGIASAVTGFWLAHALDASIAGAMATMVGFFFTLTYLLAPQHGVIAAILRRRRNKWVFAEKMLTIHLLNHENFPEAEQENRIAHLEEHLSWETSFARRIVRHAEDDKLVRRSNGHLELTDEGRALARQTIVET